MDTHWAADETQQLIALHRIDPVCVWSLILHEKGAQSKHRVIRTKATSYKLTCPTAALVKPLPLCCYKYIKNHPTDHLLMQLISGSKPASPDLGLLHLLDPHALTESLNFPLLWILELHPQTCFSSPAPGLESHLSLLFSLLCYFSFLFPQNNLWPFTPI